MKLKPIILGFAGKPQVGKTTAAEYVAEKYGAKSFFIGDGVKKEVDLMLNAIGMSYDEAEKARFRPLLTWLAVERRNQDPDYWVKILLKFISMPAVVSDIRYPNEVHMVEKSGGVVWRIVRERDTSQDDLETEKKLDQHRFAEAIDNNGSLKDLYKKIDELLVKYGLLE